MLRISKGLFAIGCLVVAIYLIVALVAGVGAVQWR